MRNLERGTIASSRDVPSVRLLTDRYPERFRVLLSVIPPVIQSRSREVNPGWIELQHPPGLCEYRCSPNRTQR